MSNPSKDTVNDYVQDHSLDMLKEWVESDDGWSEFVGWFWSASSEGARNAIFEAFLADYKAKEVIAFNEYACQEAYERLSSGPEDDPRQDR